MSPAVQCLVIVAIVAFFFVTELLPLAVTSMAGFIAVGLAGLIPIKTVFSGLSNSTVVLFAGMFVVGAAMFHTGYPGYLLCGEDLSAASADADGLRLRHGRYHHSRWYASEYPRFRRS